MDGLPTASLNLSGAASAVVSSISSASSAFSAPSPGAMVSGSAGSSPTHGIQVVSAFKRSSPSNSAAPGSSPPQGMPLTITAPSPSQSSGMNQTPSPSGKPGSPSKHRGGGGATFQAPSKSGGIKYHSSSKKNDKNLQFFGPPSRKSGGFSSSNTPRPPPIFPNSAGGSPGRQHSGDDKDRKVRVSKGDYSPDTLSMYGKCLTCRKKLKKTQFYIHRSSGHQCHRSTSDDDEEMDESEWSDFVRPVLRPFIRRQAMDDMSGTSGYEEDGADKDLNQDGTGLQRRKRQRLSTDSFMLPASAVPMGSSGMTPNSALSTPADIHAALAAASKPFVLPNGYMEKTDIFLAVRSEHGEWVPFTSCHLKEEVVDGIIRILETATLPGSSLPNYNNSNSNNNNHNNTSINSTGAVPATPAGLSSNNNGSFSNNTPNNLNISMMQGIYSTASAIPTGSPMANHTHPNMPGGGGGVLSSNLSLLAAAASSSNAMIAHPTALSPNVSMGSTVPTQSPLPLHPPPVASPPLPQSASASSLSPSNVSSSAFSVPKRSDMKDDCPEKDKKK